MANPILIEVTRGPLAESLHRGAVAIIDAAGRAVLRVGDTAAPVFPRSAVKVFQAIPLLTSGAAETFGYGDRELALACASHGGEPRHTELAASMLARAGLDASALECGAHAPSNPRAAGELLAAGGKPTALHNNCSGKHSGMLAVARHLREPHKSYVKPDHPVQRRIAALMSELTGVTAGAYVCAVDGCSVPTWALPLEAWALGFARLAAAGPASPAPLAAGRRLIEACMAEPGFVAGEKRFCTDVMAAFGGAAFVKTGAEGVFCAAIPGRGLGIALKIDDGATRASEAAMAGVLAALLPGHEDVLLRWSAKPIRNVNGAKVGSIRQSPDFAAACTTLAGI